MLTIGSVAAAAGLTAISIVFGGAVGWLAFHLYYDED